MNCSKYAYERSLSGVRGDGEAIGIKVAIGVPYKDDSLKSWACPVKAEGLSIGLATLRGVNSWRAYRHSQSFAVSLLHDFLDKGGKLYTADGYEEMTKEDIDGFIRQAIVRPDDPAAQVQLATTSCR